MIWRRSQVADLRKSALDAQSAIAKVVDSSASRLTTGSTVWGQFLDATRRSTQHGIYGTSAALQILTESGSPQTNVTVQEGRGWMPGISPRPEAPGVDPTDNGLTMKLAAAVCCAEMNEAGKYARVEPAEEQLIAHIIDGSGWGHYFFAGDADSMARTLPTAHALLALSRSKKFTSSPVCIAVLEWLAKSVTDQEDLPAYELAMTGLALLAYPGQAHEVSGHKEALSAVSERLAQWASARQRSAIGESTPFHFEAPTGADSTPHNHYVFYLVDALAIRFLLAMDQTPHETRDYILKVVQELIANTKQNSGYKAKGGRVASVDQLEVYRALGAFAEKAARGEADMLPPVLRLISGTKSRRVISSVVTLLFSLLMSLIAIDNDVSSIWRASAGVVLALLLGVLAAVWVAWAGGGP